MNEIERKFTLTVPSSTENLALIREFIGTVGVQAGLDESDVAKLTLAVDEACSNIIEHVYGHDLSKEVTVRAIFDEEVVRIEVFDIGGFDLNTVKSEEIDRLIADRKSGGLGIRLIKLLMDEVHYEIEPGQKNGLLMTKHIRKKSLK
jgi:serine/threonine-protein kinase RsbW